MTSNVIRIGSRGSVLALSQADWVKQSLEKKYSHLKVAIKKIKTKGDKILGSPLAGIKGKGLFVKEIEDALLREDIDMAVHSMKDVPTGIPAGLLLAAIPKREDIRDAFISRDGLTFAKLPSGSRIGTSSLRRQAQIKNLRPDLLCETLRGNLDTRMRKLSEGKFDAIIVAMAGLKRLKMEDKATEILSPEIFFPAIGQGALAIESRADDSRINNCLAFLEHRPTRMAVAAERSFLSRLGGGCQVPIAAHGMLDGNILSLSGIVLSEDGKVKVKDKIQGIIMDVKSAEEIGKRLAEVLLSRGASDILSSRRSML